MTCQVSAQYVDIGLRTTDTHLQFGHLVIDLAGPLVSAFDLRTVYITVEEAYSLVPVLEGLGREKHGCTSGRCIAAKAAEDHHLFAGLIEDLCQSMRGP